MKSPPTITKKTKKIFPNTKLIRTYEVDLSLSV
jgi:hypothetical protein